MVLSRWLRVGIGPCAAAVLYGGCGDSSDASNGAPSVDAASTADGGSPSDGGDSAIGSSDSGPAGDSAALPTDARDDPDGSVGDAASPTQSMGIPMYLDPTDQAADWSKVIGAAPTVSTLIANPNDGPGNSVDATYTQVIGQALAHGQTVTGYVHTSFGNRAIDTVESEITAWYAQYPSISGIFLDETPTAKNKIAAYYKPLYDFIKAKSARALVVVNPGAIPDEGYMAVSDVVMSFEDTYATYTGGAYPPNPPWMANYDRSRFWHIVLSTPEAELQNAITIARQRNAGLVFITPEGPATAYQTLPSGTYWTTEQAAVATS